MFFRQPIFRLCYLVAYSVGLVLNTWRQHLFLFILFLQLLVQLMPMTFVILLIF